VSGGTTPCQRCFSFEEAAWFWALGAWYDKSKVTLSIPHYLLFFSLEHVFIIAPTFLLV
jgi:hypothetical protein